MHPTHPTLHELALAATPPRPDRSSYPARTSVRTRRDDALVRLGSVIVRLGLRLSAAGRRPAPHHSGAPPDPRPAA